MEKKKKLLEGMVLIVLFIAIALVLLNNFMLYERSTKVTEAKEIIKEELRPADLQIIKITLENCDFCFDITIAIDELKNKNVNITQEKTFSADSIEGKELINKYDLKKLPTILITGEINKTEQLTTYLKEKGEINEGTFIYTSLIPPYLDTQLNRLKGLVSITNVIDSSCEKCLGLTGVSSALKNKGVFVKDEKFIEYNSKEGQDLIKKFGIKQVPAVLISKEIDYYGDVKEALLQAGANEKENYYAIHSTSPPYRDISKNEIVGLVDVIYLINTACPD